MSDLLFDSGSAREWIDPKAKYAPNGPARLVGVEIEVARSDVFEKEPHCDDPDCDESSIERNAHAYQTLTTVLAKWHARMERDGSLPETGFEIPIAPASGVMYQDQVGEIAAALAAVHAKATSACGLHVHVDCRDLTWTDIRRIVRLYAHLEDVLCALVPATRLTSGFCNACGERYLQWLDGSFTIPKIKEKLQSNLYGYARNEGRYAKSSGDRWESIKHEKYQQARYYALNLHSWVYRGTLEWRLPSGTVEAAKITRWGQLASMMITHAATHTEAQITQLIALPPKEALLSILTPQVQTFVNARWARYGNGRV